MYAYIKGELTEVLEDRITVEAGGVGYEILVPATVFDELPMIGDECKIYTYYHVREDARILCGFLSRSDKRIFQQLLTVNGVGPKAALDILSALSPEDLQFAILSEDVKALSSAKGIGLKTAKKLILAHASKKSGRKLKGSTIKPKRDLEDGIPVYEAEFKEKGISFDYEIHARTGKILKYCIEWPAK